MQRAFHELSVLVGHSFEENLVRARRSVREEVDRDIDVLAHEGPTDRRHLIEAVFDVDLGAALDEKRHHLEVASLRRKEERGGAVTVANVDVGPGIQERPHRGHVPGARRLDQWFLAALKRQQKNDEPHISVAPFAEAIQRVPSANV